MPKSIMENPSINGSFQSPGPCVPRAPRAPRAPGGPRHPLPHSSPATSKPVHGMGKPLDLGRSENHQLVLLWPSNHWWKYIDIYIYIHTHTYIHTYICIYISYVNCLRWANSTYDYIDGMMEWVSKQISRKPCDLNRFDVHTIIKPTKNMTQHIHDYSLMSCKRS